LFSVSKHRNFNPKDQLFRFLAKKDQLPVDSVKKCVDATKVKENRWFSGFGECLTGGLLDFRQMDASASLKSRAISPLYQ
jgi:hypothetical protein